MECLKFVNSLPEDRKILVEGNHEDLLKLTLRRHMFAWHDTHNGTDKTVKMIAEDTKCYHDDIFKDDVYADCENNPELKKYFDSLVFYHETPHHVFVHGWIPTKTARWYGRGDWRDVADHRSAWFSQDYGAAWENGMESWHYGQNDSEGKTVVCGHWHSNWGHCILHKDSEVLSLEELIKYKDGMDKDEWSNIAAISTRTFKDNGIVALDACTVLSNRVNVEVITEEDL